MFVLGKKCVKVFSITPNNFFASNNNSSNNNNNNNKVCQLPLFTEGHAATQQVNGGVNGHHTKVSLFSKSFFSVLKLYFSLLLKSGFLTTLTRTQESGFKRLTSYLQLERKRSDFSQKKCKCACKLQLQSNTYLTISRCQ